MGLFDLFNDLLDENSNGSLEKRLSGAIDRVEATLNQTLDKAEGGIQRANEAIDKLDQTATLAEEKVVVVSEKIEATAPKDTSAE